MPVAGPNTGLLPADSATRRTKSTRELKPAERLAEPVTGAVSLVGNSSRQVFVLLGMMRYVPVRRRVRGAGVPGPPARHHGDRGRARAAPRRRTVHPGPRRVGDSRRRGDTAGPGRRNRRSTDTGRSKTNRRSRNRTAGHRPDDQHQADPARPSRPDPHRGPRRARCHRRTAARSMWTSRCPAASPPVKPAGPAKSWPSPTGAAPSPPCPSAPTWPPPCTRGPTAWTPAPGYDPGPATACTGPPPSSTA